jgi:hypothetical protein
MDLWNVCINHNITRRHNPELLDLNLHRRENLKFSINGIANWSYIHHKEDKV